MEGVEPEEELDDNKLDDEEDSSELLLLLSSSDDEMSEVESESESELGNDGSDGEFTGFGFEVKEAMEASGGGVFDPAGRTEDLGFLAGLERRDPSVSGCSVIGQ